MTRMLLIINHFIAHVATRVSLARKTALLLSALTLLISSNHTALAGNQDSADQLSYRQEAITPIPQVIEFNQVKASLGESLFYDTRLSANNSISCATCHQLDSGGDDNVALGVSLSSEQQAVNTPTVFNAQFNFKQNWDGSAKTLDKQIDNAIENHLEFSNKWEIVVSRLQDDAKLKNSFKQIYKNGITKDNIINSIVEFEKTLFTPNSRFDRYLRNEIDLTHDEKKGYALFKNMGCISCHQGVNVGGNVFQKFGVFYNYLAEQGDIKKSDYGRYNITQRQQDKFVFKVPSLRNISVTSPYLHNGSAATLEDAIRIMGSTQLGRKLDDTNVSLIKIFLDTLTGEYKNKPIGTTL